MDELSLGGGSWIEGLNFKSMYRMFDTNLE